VHFADDPRETWSSAILIESTDRSPRFSRTDARARARAPAYARAQLLFNSATFFRHFSVATAARRAAPRRCDRTSLIMTFKLQIARTKICRIPGVRGRPHSYAHTDRVQALVFMRAIYDAGVFHMQRPYTVRKCAAVCATEIACA